MSCGSIQSMNGIFTHYCVPGYGSTLLYFLKSIGVRVEGLQKCRTFRKLNAPTIECSTLVTTYLYALFWRSIAHVLMEILVCCSYLMLE